MNPSTGIFALWKVPNPQGHYVNRIALDGGLVYSAGRGEWIRRLDPSTGAFTEWPVTADGLVAYRGLIYFIEGENNKIGRLDPSTGSITQWTLPTPYSKLKALAMDNGKIYYTEHENGRIGCLDPLTGVFIEWGVPSRFKPYGIATHGGLVYFTGLNYYAQSSGCIGCLNPSNGVLTVWTAGGSPSAIAVENGLVYYRVGGPICRLDPSTGSIITWSGGGEGQDYQRLHSIAVYRGLVYFHAGQEIGLLVVDPIHTRTVSVTSVDKTLSSVTTNSISTALGRQISTGPVMSSTYSVASRTASTTSRFTSYSWRLDIVTITTSFQPKTATSVAVAEDKVISLEVRKWYDAIENLPSESRILVDYGITEDAEPEIGPFAVAVLHHIFRRAGLKTIFVTTATQGVNLWETAMREVKPEDYGRKYGEDYAMLGYVRGETAVAALGQDLRKTAPKDYKGTPVEQLSVMKGIFGAEDVTMVMCFTSDRKIAPHWLRHWQVPYKRPCLYCVSANMIQELSSYYKAGMIVLLL